MDVGQRPVEIVDVGQPKAADHGVELVSFQQSRFGYIRVEVTDAQRLTALELLRLAKHCSETSTPTTEAPFRASHG
jgi:hypothetical protein